MHFSIRQKGYLTSTQQYGYAHEDTKNIFHSTAEYRFVCAVRSFEYVKIAMQIFYRYRFTYRGFYSTREPLLCFGTSMNMLMTNKITMDVSPASIAAFCQRTPLNSSAAAE